MKVHTGLIKGVTARNAESITVSVTYNYDSDFYDSLSELVVDSEDMKTGRAVAKQVVLRKAEPGERTGQLVLGDGD